MSKDIEFLIPMFLVICTDAITPAAGPDSAVCTGCSAATSKPTIPPLDFMIESDASILNSDKPF